jgi:hypothetical protein
MPYAVSKSGSGYKVRNKNTGKTYSKHSQSKATAVAQMRAIEMHSHGRNGEFSKGASHR